MIPKLILMLIQQARWTSKPMTDGRSGINILASLLLEKEVLFSKISCEINGKSATVVAKAAFSYMSHFVVLFVCDLTKLALKIRVQS